MIHWNPQNSERNPYEISAGKLTMEMYINALNQ